MYISYIYTYMMAKVVVMGLCVLTHGAVHRTSQELSTDNDEQFGLAFPSSGLSFTAVQPK